MNELIEKYTAAKQKWSDSLNAWIAADMNDETLGWAYRRAFDELVTISMEVEDRIAQYERAAAELRSLLDNFGG